MKHLLTLPDPGYATRRAMRSHAKLARSAAPRPWVAVLDAGQITRFVSGLTDLAGSHGSAGSGVAIRFFLDSGATYLVSEPDGCGGAARYRVRIEEDGHGRTRLVKLA